MGVEVWMVFEAVGPEKEGVENSLDEHVETLRNEEKGVEVLEIERDEATEMENPHPGLEKGYSQVVEAELEMEDFQKAVEAVINYGPTYVQFQGPDNYSMNLAESQNVLQSVANTMHQYAQMGTGGVLIGRSAKENDS
ncbi:MAG: hypothetical protein ABEJ98_02280 [Candidatus Nanohaloarchaea archaeon]